MLENITYERKNEVVISDAAKQTLHDQLIDDQGPGTILRDFDTLLDFIGEEGLATTSKYFLLPQSRLNDLNAVMSHPVVLRLKRPQQRSFPHLHGLYLLLRASGMGISVGSSPGGRLMLETETVDAWRELNDTERYFVLLESWIIQGSPEVLAERGGWSGACFQSLLDLAQELRNKKTPVDDCRGGVLYGTMTLVTVALMELFGWVRFEYGNPATGEGVKIVTVERLLLGDAIVSSLMAFSLTDRWPRLYHDEVPESGALLPLFQTYFPNFQQTLARKEWSFREGTYVWRVSLSQVWRQIAAPAETSLDDLAMTILDAFKFDADHLYCFELRQTNGRTLRIACPYEEDALVFTDDVALGDLAIAERDTMTMTFDYGDNWKFNVKLEEVTPPDESLDRPRITAKQGTPPVQYEWAE